MLVIKNQEHFDKVCAFAAKKSAEHSEWLWEQLNYLDTYAEHGKRGKTRCLLGFDSAPASFGFSMEIQNHEGVYEHWFSGGLIYFGDQSGWIMRDGREIPPGYGVETFTVRIGEHKSPWSIHT